MEPNLDEIASVALQLSIESRAKRLRDSLDDLTLAEPERLWAAEAARRYQELKSGTARGVAAEEVFAELEARMRR